MISSTNHFHDFVQSIRSDHDPGFTVIVSFEFYDGPETGIALYASGEGVRFLDIAESRYRVFRAYELAPLSGNWWPIIKEIGEAADLNPSERITLIPSDSAELTHLKTEVLNAPARELYVGVGRTYLDHLYVAPVTQDQLGYWRQLDVQDAFRSAHQLVKNHNRTLIGYQSGQ